ncbi:helix-turn-helix transcriptional regulator [Nocardia stercoris]|nr:LuxR C-terminal-related transcriptional regulator [Nocardia stercoris]
MNHHGQRTAEPTPDDTAAALTSAIADRDWQTAISLIENSWVTLLLDDPQLLRVAAEAIPESELSEHPTLLAGRKLFTHWGSTNTSGLIELPSDPEELRALGETPKARDALSVGAVRMIMQRATGEFRRAADIARTQTPLVSSASESQPDTLGAPLAIVRFQRGITYQLSGSFTEATSELQQAYRAARAAGLTQLARDAALESALGRAVAGDILQARRRLGQAPAGLSGRSVGSVAQALVALERLDPPDAGAVLDDIGEPEDRDEMWSFVVYARAQYALAIGQPFLGLAHLTRGVAANADTCRPGGIAYSLLTASEIDLRLAGGEGNKAIEIADSVIGDDPWTVVAAARANLFARRPTVALALCHRVDWFQSAQPRPHLEALLVQAAAHEALGETDSADTRWVSACTLIEQTGLLRPLALVPTRLVRTLSERTGVSTSGVAEFLAAATPSVFPTDVPVVRLTDREQAILRELARGEPLRKIAEKQFVSINTVKTQLRSMYQKVGGHSREEAVAIARKLGLLQLS